MAAVLRAVVLLALLLLAGVQQWVGRQDFWDYQSGETQSGMEYGGVEYSPRGWIETVLVLGLDKRDNIASDSYRNDKQSDFLMLFVIDHERKTCQAIHINRDTMAEISVLGLAGDRVDTVTEQIALAHTYGNGREVSCRNAADAVSNLLLGVSIDHCVSVTMEAVGVYNDLVGGVTLEVLDDFTGVDDTLVKGTTVTLQGEHALHYVRSRYGLEDSTNNRRMVRQKQYLEALYQKTLQVAGTNGEFSAQAMAQLADHVVADCSGNKLERLFQQMTEYENLGMRDLVGQTVKGEEYMEFYPDEDALKKLVAECFYVKK